MEVVDLPLGYTSGQAATIVVNQVFEQLAPKELQDTQVMYLHAHGPGLLHTRKKAVKTLDDLEGMKIRAHGTSAKIVQALGGTPVAKSMGENYRLLQKGVVDGSVYPGRGQQGLEAGRSPSISPPAAIPPGTRPVSSWS